jgi:Transposase DDE domain
MVKQVNIPTQITTPTNEIAQVQKFFTDSYKEKRQLGRPSKLTTSDIGTILMIQNQFGNCNLLRLYNLLKTHYLEDFELPCYKNFVLTMHRKTVNLIEYLQLIFQYFSSEELLFIDSSALPVCKIYKEKKHKTMKQLARKSKTTTGWYYGLKLHLVSDINGNPVFLRFTTATVDDRVILGTILDKFNDKIFVADAGYLGVKYQKQGIENNNFTLTPCRSNMKVLSTIWQNNMMNMRSIIESVFSSLKTHYGLVDSISRSVNGYLTNYLRAIFRYCFRNIDNYVILS